MTEPPLPLTALSEAQRSQATARLTIIRSALQDGVTQTQGASTHHISVSTLPRWGKQYREKGLAGLADAKARSDNGKSPRLPPDAITLFEGLALQAPPRSMAALHRQVSALALEQGGKPPSYNRVRHIINHLDPALVTLAHQGPAASREDFDLLYRRESTPANALWQADHTPLDVWLLDDAGKPAKPYLTAIEDDYSRVFVGYWLSFQGATARTSALTLRQAIWHKDDPRWSACGIPSFFYTDHGSDFTSKHLEQVAADSNMELVFSEPGVPRGRGKVERFFRSLDQLFLQDVPGSAPKDHREAEATFSLPDFEQRFRMGLLEDDHHRVQSETECQPKDRWERGGFVPRMLASLEHLDLLLLLML
jgi:putative transposase